jgi:hypothetical protein
MFYYDFYSPQRREDLNWLKANIKSVMSQFQLHIARKSIPNYLHELGDEVIHIYTFFFSFLFSRSLVFVLSLFLQNIIDENRYVGR